MDAFVEIIEQLVDKIHPQTWLQLSNFPFKNISSPKGRVFDICLFETDVKGAYGFMWITFQNTEDLFILPFALARYKEDGDLISWSPWSLRQAFSDPNFYEAWRKALKLRNPLPTAKNGHVTHKKQSGDPSFIAHALSGNEESTSVRIDFQIVYKISRIMRKTDSLNVEVDVLSYLGTQNIFLNYPKLLSVFEYTSSRGDVSNLAIGSRYVDTVEPLFTTFVTLLYKCRKIKKFREQNSKNAWEKIIYYTESAGRLLGDFHRAVLRPPKSSPMHPEQNQTDGRQNWQKNLVRKMEESYHKTIALKNQFPSFSGLFFLLPDFVEKVKQNFIKTSDVGLRFKNHGNLNLWEIFVGAHELVILNFDDVTQIDGEDKWIKHPYLCDFANMMVSFRFAWYFAERRIFATSDKLDFEEQFSLLSYQERQPSFFPTLEAIESTFSRFYFSSLNEEAAKTLLRSKSLLEEKNIFDFYLLTFILQGIAKETPPSHSNSTIWLHILQEIVVRA